MSADKSFRAKLFAKYWPVGALGVSLLATPVAVLAENEWEASVGLRSEVTDNANKSSTDPLTERQDEANLTVGGSYENSLIEAGANYRLSERRFDKDSQPSRSRLQGDGRLLIGKAHDRADLLLTHTRRTVLNQPDDLDLLRNNDEREIFTAVPTARWRATRVDLLMLSGTYAQVDYRFNSERNSERLGASALWQRELSETDRFSLDAQQMDVTFDAFPAADYRYTAYSAAYAVELRRLNYRVQLGYNESEPEVGEGISSPSYQISLGYGSGMHQWNISASRFVTDNSAGNGNQGDFDEFNPDDSSAGQLDQLERSRMEISWRSQALCQRCSSALTLFHQEDDYRVEEEDRTEQGLRLSTDYRLSTRSSVRAILQSRNHSFASSVERSDYRADTLRLSYDYQFPTGLGWSVFGRYQERSSDDDARTYEESVVGLSADYSF